MNARGAFTLRQLALLLILIGSGCTLSAPAEPSSSAPAAAAQPSTQPAAQTRAAATYYVRPDGGSPEECTGRADAPYRGGGSGQPCAWDHPFRALQPGGERELPGTARIAGGDTLLIAPGSYMMGLGAPGAEACDEGYPWDCYMPPIPSGPDPAHPTRLLGAGWNTGCADPPELWGRERALLVLNLTASSNVEIACLEVTDHAGCVEDHSGGLACERDSYPYGDWAAAGLYAEDAANVTLRNLDIHGLARAGVHAGRLRDWTVEDVRLAGNGWVGWDGDLEGDDANGGALTFRRWLVEWNGCAESYPEGQPAGCWGQSAGGYGDGVGTGATGGDWLVEDSAFLHNTSDGLDLLYHTLGGRVTIRRTLAEGNAGDQLKTAGPTLVENTVAIANCGFFAGKPFTYNVDPCRAGGSAVALTLHPGDEATLLNSTLTGQGDCLLIAECAADERCAGAESVLLRNDIFLGNPEFAGDDTTCFAWSDLAEELFVLDHSLLYGLKGMPVPCPPGSLCGVAPFLVNEEISSFDAHLAERSPAVDAGSGEAAPVDDFAGRPRDSRPDIGAYELGE